MIGNLWILKNSLVLPGYCFQQCQIDFNFVFYQLCYDARLFILFRQFFVYEWPNIMEKSRLCFRGCPLLIIKLLPYAYIFSLTLIKRPKILYESTTLIKVTLKSSKCLSLYSSLYIPSCCLVFSYLTDRANITTIVLLIE